MVFNVGEFVEAVDECGHWATSKVVEIVNAMVLVTFVGWSSRFNRWVQHEEVRRPAADEPENSVGGKRSKRKCETTGDGQMRRLVRGDRVKIAENGIVSEVEVWLVDKFNRVITVQTEDGKKDIGADMLYDKDDSESASSTASQKKVRRGPRIVPTKRATSECQATQTDMPTSAPTSAPTSVPDVTCLDNVYVKVNDNGDFIEGGDVCVIKDSSVTVGVTNLLRNGTASGSLIVGNTVISDVTVTAPINKLRGTVSGLSRKDTASLRKHSLFANREKLASAPVPLRRSVREALVGGLLRKEVQSGLRLASFKKSFTLGVISPEFDFDIFGFQMDPKVEYSYSQGNLSCLDGLLGKFWDIQKPEGNCLYVTKLILKVRDQQLCGKVCFARCRQTLPSDYRSFLSKYDIGNDGQSDVDEY